ncbi:uncharacterized protein PV09_08540 [Verruconis gallopava]|uniref:RNA polymerase II-associated protein 1 N-terminal domain-containing protein n=1 Tax=Verruconis gallopava TaxID=253628 RepID=A0A0D2ALC4_9PEZI|nr:uncharacterized protein PV09_08540 [Verruconis gallopava]KIV99873.1 hypothetical protein PV09_08540 [Verruconis gallopava]
MARIPGERFEIDLDDDTSLAPHDQPQGSVAASSASTIPGFVADVLEREIRSEVTPPSFKSANTATGFPEHKKRTGLSKFRQSKNASSPSSAAASAAPAGVATATSDMTGPSSLTPRPNHDSLSEERKQIDEENRKTIASMTDAEIQAERQELFAGLSPALIEKLLKRSNIDDEPQATEPELSPKAKPSEGENRRPSCADRRVSFALPEEMLEEKESSTTASRHSITSSPSPSLAAKFGSASNSDVSELGLSRTSSNASTASRRSSSGHAHERKVSFVLPDYIELARKANPTAAKHSVASPPVHAADNAESTQQQNNSAPELSRTPSGSAMKSPGQRPVDHARKVSFALPESQITGERRPSSAASHSLSSSPSPRFVDGLDSLPAEPVDDLQLSQPEDGLPPADQGTIHFPKPPAAPELDPNAPTFLEDLHKNYFPNLAHDPSKLAWMAPATDEENASYDPSRTNLDPKDVRFDFKGRIIPPSRSAQIPTDAGLHHHGDAPSAAGYTISELGLLARSAFPAQRSLAIQTIGRILYRLGRGEFGNENDIDVDGPDGERAMLAKGLWEAVEESRVIDTITAEAAKDRGHQTSIALAQEAVWNWRKGGGRQRKAV